MFTSVCVCEMWFLFLVIVTGRKGGHKGRMRTYTSPEEIDAQMKAEKERKKVSKGSGKKLYFFICQTVYWSS